MLFISGNNQSLYTVVLTRLWSQNVRQCWVVIGAGGVHAHSYDVRAHLTYNCSGFDSERDP